MFCVMVWLCNVVCDCVSDVVCDGVGDVVSGLVDVGNVE